MSKALYTNNAATTLPSGITSSATSITVTDGFVFPSPADGDYAYLTISSGLNQEIVKLTARSGNTLTVVRGQQGTSARAFDAASVVSLRPTAASFSDLYTYVDNTRSVTTKAAIQALNPAVARAATLSGNNWLENGTYHWREGDFSALVAADTYGAYYLEADSVSATVGAYVREHQANVYDINHFGADPTGVADSLAAYNIAAALILASGVIGQIDFSGNYRNSSTLVVTSNIIINAKARSTLTPIGANTHGFRFQAGPGVYIGKNILPALLSMAGTAIDLDGCDFADVYCPQVLSAGGGGTAIRLGATGGGNCLDNTVHVDIIGTMAEWCRVETDAGEVIQGNLVTSNFATTVRRGVVFKCDGAVQPNWDSNRFEMEAWDPTPTITDSALVYARNSTTHEVARQIIKVHSWCGGLGSSSKIMDVDSTNGVELYIAPAEVFPSGYMDVTNGINNTYNFRNNASRIATVYAASLTAVGKGTWNSGVPMTQNTELISVTPTSDLAANATITAYVYHEFADDYTNLIAVSQGWSTAGGLICVAAETRGWTGSGADKEIGLIFRNVSGATITAGTSHQFKIKVGLP